ncbi:copper chaperone PCu(A)C [Niveispirillum irakense]|uniref:copper chaperone PCu(A)C n=1 Tax=Niveispirillum irakense TaxID=34011 RepID=UPI00040E7A94|nr:copper chaperone PCu(A)C [Niveispirillum irakense]
MFHTVAALFKAVGYAAALTAAGTVMARASLARGLPAVPTTLGLTRWAGVVLSVTAWATALLFFLRLGGDGSSATLKAIFLSPLGAALGLQMIGGLWVAVYAKRAVALAGALLILGAFGVVGHSASHGLQTSVTVVLHVTAAAWWFGGLWVLLVAGRTLPADRFADLVGRFSRQAMVVVCLLLAAALMTSALLLEFRLVPTLAYPRGLLTKLALTGGLLMLAGINKLILTPRLAVRPKARVWLRWMIAADLLLFVGIIATTAYVTTYLSPHAASAAMHTHQGQFQVEGPIGIADPWAPAMPGSAATGAGYMVIVNNQPVDDRLVAVSSPWAERVTLHASIMEDEIARMRRLEALPIPHGGRVVLEPGTFHLMFSGLYAPFVAGDSVPVTLTFEQAGRVDVVLTVHPLTRQRLPGHEH